MTSEVLTYLYPILFSVVFGYYNGWQWIDEQDGVYDPLKAKKRWKAASVVLRGLALVALFIDVDLRHLPVAVAVSLPVFDMTINLVAGKGLFYLGTTSKTDRLGRLKWFAYLGLIIATIVFLWLGSY